MRRYAAEAIGTFGLVFTGCGAMLVGGSRLGDAGVALAFGLGLTAMSLAAGPISGGHFNPAVTAAMALTRRLPTRAVLPYVAAQLAGATAAAAAVVAIAGDRPGGTPGAAASISGGYGRLSPGYYGVEAAFLCEVVLTTLFVLVVLRLSPPPRAPESSRPRSALAPALLPLGAGLAYALVHLVGLPVTRLAANPARAFGPAIVAGGNVLLHLWVFLVAPLAGAVIAAGIDRALSPAPDQAAIDPRR